jgi:hypothetical protein
MIDTRKLVLQLQAERESLDRLILAAMEYDRGGRPRRGRPPKFMAARNKRSMGQALRRARERQANKA